jgi:homoserine dehydrogenase
MAELRIAVIGCGLVGSEFISQVQEYQRQGRRPMLDLGVVMNSKRMIVDRFDDWKRSLEKSEIKSDYKLFIKECLKYKRCVVVDCTCSDLVAGMYPEFLSNGLSVVTPNKKAFSGDLGLFQEVHFEWSTLDPTFEWQGNWRMARCLS